MNTSFFYPGILLMDGQTEFCDSSVHVGYASREASKQGKAHDEATWRIPIEYRRIGRKSSKQNSRGITSFGAT